MRARAEESVTHVTHGLRGGQGLPCPMVSGYWGQNNMKKYNKIVAASMILAMLGMFAVLYQLQSEDAAANEYPVYEMNHNWRFISSASDTQVSEEETGAAVSLPYEGVSSPGEKVVFENTVTQDYAGLTLVFYSNESTVQVSLDGKVIYQYGAENQRRLGKSPGSRVNLVDLPEQIGDGCLRIELVSSYKNEAATLGRVTASGKDIVILQLIESNLVKLLSCVIMLISSVGFLLLGTVCIRTSQKTYGVFWLAALGLDTGVFYLIKTETLSIFYGAQAIYSMGQYLFIMLIPIFLLLHLKHNLEKARPRLLMALFTAASINVFAQLLLQVTNIYDLVDMVKYSAILFNIVVVISIVLYVREAVVYSKKINWFLASLFVMQLAGEFVSVYMPARAQFNDNKDYSQYAMTIFLFTLAICHTFQVTRDYRRAAEKSTQLALAASEAKGKFLANMSHEIRTPINAVLGMDEMILRESRETKIREYAMDIFTAGQALLSIINDILDLSKIESGKMEIIPVNYEVSSMIHDLSNMTELRAKKKHLQFHVEADREIPCTLHGDDVRIRQVLTNILTNAVKYTQEGDIWFRISQRTKGDGKITLHFEVEDTGAGIREEDLPKLYAEFERIEEDKNRNIEGTGLGMSITRQFLQMMDSQLEVESVYGKGSKFSFDLEQEIVEDKPIGDFEKSIQQLAADFSYKAGFTAPDAEVLVVDDNAINRKVFQSLLHQTLVKITEAESGAKCLELTRQKHFDIIFLDHMMPEMDGIETLQRIKDDRENLCGNVPVIALTANAVSGVREKYLEAGFDGYLPKPIVSAKLEKMLRDFLPDELVKDKGPEEGMPQPAAEALAEKMPQAAGAEASAVGTRQAAVTEASAEGMQQAAVVEAPDLEQLPMVEGLDWNYAWMHLLNMDLLQDTVVSFYEQIPSSAEKLSACYQDFRGSGELKPYRIQVHTMKSLAASLGIIPLAGMAKILEDAAENKQQETIHSLHPVFIAEWNSYRGKLTGVFGIKAPEEKEQPKDLSMICVLLEMLRIAMQDMDIDQADEKMKMIYAYRYQDEVQKNVELLKTAVEDLDPEQVEMYAQTIIGQLSGQKGSVS